MSVSEEVAGPSKQIEKVRKPVKYWHVVSWDQGRCTPGSSEPSDIRCFRDTAENRRVPIDRELNGHLGDCSFTKVVGMKACRVLRTVGPEQKDTAGLDSSFQNDGSGQRRERQVYRRM